METLATFFDNLAKYEGMPSVRLAARWKRGDVKSITNDFSRALRRCSIDLSVPGGTSTPALGNRVADAVADGLDQHLVRYRLCRCTGQGYPDRRLLRVRDNRSFALELKAKTEFNPRDTNRVILTCGSRKLRRSFGTRQRICHLLATVFYTKSRSGRRCRIVINGLRFDFLEPWTPVRKRYEASVNQHMLSKADHSTRLLLAKGSGAARGGENLTASTYCGRVNTKRKPSSNPLRDAVSKIK